MTSTARQTVDAAAVQPEMGRHQAPPESDLVSKVGRGPRGLVKPRNARIEDGIGTVGSLRETDGIFGAARYPMDAGITGGISMLFGNPDDETSP
jgi:hypothetical protein